jgi:tRNA A-37 threonylcarbamoyl transferase component Bud32
MNSIGDGFVEKQEGAVHACVRRQDADCIAAALLEGKGCEPLNASGRGGMMQFPLPGGRTGVLRVHRRGGLLGHILKEGFFLWNRPFMEFCIHSIVLQKGVPAPDLLGVRWERRGLLYYGALATELLPGDNLHGWLSANKDNAAETKETLHKCGACIRLMHDKETWHADLQVKNLFVSNSGIFLLDFDKAQLHEWMSSWKCARNLLRLRRSFEKLGYPPSFWLYILDGYGEITIPWELSTAYRVKAWFSDMIHIRRNTQV